MKIVFGVLVAFISLQCQLARADTHCYDFRNDSGGVVTLAYGMLFGPALAGRGPLVQSIATLGLALVLFGAIDLVWPTTGGQSPSISFPTDSFGSPKMYYSTAHRLGSDVVDPAADGTRSLGVRTQSRAPGMLSSPIIGMITLTGRIIPFPMAPVPPPLSAIFQISCRPHFRPLSKSGQSPSIPARMPTRSKPTATHFPSSVQGL